MKTASNINLITIQGKRYRSTHIILVRAARSYEGLVIPMLNCTAWVLVLACRENAEKLKALTQEVYALKITEAQLLSATAAANGNADAAEARIAYLESELAQRQAPQTSSSPWAAPWFTSLTSAHGCFSSSDLHATLAAKESEIFTLRSELLSARQGTESLHAKVVRLEESIEELKRGLQREKQAGCAALEELREEMSAQAVLERDALTAALERAQEKIAELQGQLHEEVCELDSFHMNLVPHNGWAACQLCPLSIQSDLGHHDVRFPLAM